jgi:hypothetical protein
VLVALVLGLCSVSNGEWLVQRWTNAGGDQLWVNPDNWDLWDLDIPVFVAHTGAAPTPEEEITIDPPEGAMGSHPIIRPGDAATCYGIQTILPGNPVLEMNGGNLDITRWVWWGDGPDSIGTWYMNGGKVTTTREFELGWGGGGGTLEMTGGKIVAEELVIPTGSGVMGLYFFYGGTFQCFKDNGFSMAGPGFMDIYQGAALQIAGDAQATIQSYIDSGQIIAQGGMPGYSLHMEYYDGGGKGWAYTELGVVPEPATLSLLASLLVLGGVAVLFRRKR